MKKHLILFSLLLASLSGCANEKNKEFKATFMIGNEIIGEVQHFTDEQKNIVEPVCNEEGYIYDWNEYKLESKDIIIQGYKKQMKNSIDLFDKNMVHFTGRVGEDAGEKILYNANSSYEFLIYGTTVKATMQSDKAATKVRVYIDDDLEGRIIEILRAEQEYVLASELTYGKHTIKVVKANTEQFGFITLKNISGAENYLDLSPINRPKFEFYGDSLISGYGVDCLEGDNYLNEDPTKAHAKLVSEHFNADMSSLCYSGVSIAIPNWINWLASDRFERYAYTLEGSVWDFSKWVPDYVFICLGANDGGKINESNKVQFFLKVFTMISKLKEYYPNSKIICFYGVTYTNRLVHETYQKVVDSFEEDENVYYLHSKGSTTNGYNGHLNADEQRGVANEIIEYLESNFQIK
mgnify:CR=1 FL=1